MWKKVDMKNAHTDENPISSKKARTASANNTINDWCSRFVFWLSDVDVLDDHYISGFHYSKDKKDYSDNEKIIVQKLLREFFMENNVGTGIHLNLTRFCNKFNITSIKEKTFQSLCFFKSITIPEGVTSIGTSAFAETAIEWVVIPDSVECIGSWAFASCSRLTKVVLSSKSSKLEQIESCAFHKTKLQSMNIPPCVKEIQFGAFMNTQLTTVCFPESWNYDGECDIAGGAFVQNGTLRGKVSVPVGTSISQGVFDDDIRVKINKQRKTT